MCVEGCRAGRSGLQAAAGWTDAQHQVEQLGLETLIVLPAKPLSAAVGGVTNMVEVRPPVDPALHASLAAAFWAVGLMTMARFLLCQWRGDDRRGEEQLQICNRLLTLLCLGFVSSVALGLGSFFTLLAAGVRV